MRQRFPLLLIGRGKRRYGIPFRRIVEVIPRVELQRSTRGAAEDDPAWSLAYRGQTVPALDLTQLLDGRDSVDRMDTRIVIVDVAERADEVQLLGLLAERVVDTVIKSSGDFRAAVRSSSAPYLGATTSHDGDTVQVVDVARLLGDEQRMRLYGGGSVRPDDAGEGS